MKSVRHTPDEDPPPAQTSERHRLHPAIPPTLALISIWLWAFPPQALRFEPPTIPPASQEAGLRMEMFIQLNNIQRFAAENGRIPNDRRELGDDADGVRYVPMAENTFKLIGWVGDITVDFTSGEPVEDLLADSKRIVSG